MMTPPNHVRFKAIKLASELDDEILDCSVAFIESQGGGPEPSHTHSHDHLFTVISGEIEVRFEDEKVLLTESMSLRVEGTRLHSVWNVSDEPAKVLGISLR